MNPKLTVRRDLCSNLMHVLIPHPVLSRPRQALKPWFRVQEEELR